MELQNLTSTVGFRLLHPGAPRDEHGRFRLPRRGREPALLLELLGAPFDAVNTDVGDPSLSRALRPLLDVPRMSTMAIGAVLNRAVAAMPEGQAFVNAGVWHGYTLLAAMAGNPEAICVGIDDFSEFGGPRDEFGARFEAARSPRHTFHEMDYRDYLADLHEGPIGVYLYDGENSYEGEFEALTAAEPYFAEGCVVMADDTNRSQRRQAMLDFADQSAHDYSVVLDVRTGANRHPTFWNGTLVLCRSSGAESRVIGHEPKEHAAEAATGVSSVSVVLLADGDVAAATERIRAQTWPDTELVVTESADDLGDAIERTSGDIVAFADCAADLLPDAVEISLAYPDAVRFWHGRLEEARLDRLRAGIAAGRDVDSVLEPGTPCLLVSDRLGLPDTLAAGPAAPLADVPLRDLDDDAAAGALRAAGAGHLVVLANRFAWLDERPGAAAYLGQHAGTLLDNAHARVFALGGAA